MQCQFCHQKYHSTCLTQQELSLISINKIFQCAECSLKFAQYFSYNYNNYPYGQIPNPHPMTIIPPQPVYASNQHVPLTQVKNNKKIKNITNKKQNKKNVEIIIEDEPEEINNNIKIFIQFKNFIEIYLIIIKDIIIRKIINIWQIFVFIYY